MLIRVFVKSGILGISLNGPFGATLGNEMSYHVLDKQDMRPEVSVR